MNVFYVLLTVHPCVIFFQTKPTRRTLLLSIFISTSLHISTSRPDSHPYRVKNTSVA